MFLNNLVNFVDLLVTVVAESRGPSLAKGVS